MAGLLAPTEQTLQLIPYKSSKALNNVVNQTTSLAVDTPDEPVLNGGGWPEPEKYELFFEPEGFSIPTFGK